MIDIATASERIRAKTSSLDSESVELDDALGRVLAVEIRARRPLPPRDNSAMDGYAVRVEDTPGTLPIAALVQAGARQPSPHLPGTATKIMTGAPLPKGADAVVIRENVTTSGDRVSFSDAATLGAHIRRAGEDIEAGDRALSMGTTVGPGELGLLAALAFPVIQVIRRPRVGILSTGDELVPLTESPPPDRIINSNAHALAAQVREAGGIPLPHPIVPDRKTDVIDAIGQALEDADILLTSGGVSVGDFDFVKEALVANGIEPDFWKVAMKPGKPLVFGSTPRGQLVFGLPGNPISSMVSFELFVRPALRRLVGDLHPERPRANVVIDRDYRKTPGRAHFLRASLTRSRDSLHASLFAKQGSGMLTSMSGVDALVIVDAQVAEATAGDSLEAILLRSL